ncbi:MAG: 50S ribosomal protein L27, partial [bacterium]
KKFSKEFVNGGTILVRQRGTKVIAGKNVGRGKDDTLFAKVSGILFFKEKNGKKMVEVAIP